MHPLQQKLLNLVQKASINFKKSRAICKLVDEKNPQNVKHHLMQLEKKGFVKINKSTGVVSLDKQLSTVTTDLFSLPIYGSANCGSANILADECLEGFLKVSPSVIDKKSPEGLFVVRAVGESLNAAKKIKGGVIESGDFVVVNSKVKKPDDGEYVLSIIDGAANLKRYYEDSANHRIVLVSESTSEIEPIYIHMDDNPDYIINGKVEMVIKKPSINK